jgi:hypothetical protein
MVTRLSHKRAARTAAFAVVLSVAAVSAVWAAPRLSDAAARWVQAPSVRSAVVAVPGEVPVGPLEARSGMRAASADRSPVATSPATLDAGLRLTMVGLTCRPPGAGEVDILLRTSEDGRTWSRWYVAPLEVAAEARAGTVQAFTEPVWTGGGRYVQVKARPRDGGPAPAALRDVRLIAIDSPADDGRSGGLAGAARRVVAVVSGLGVPAPAHAMTKKPAIVTRAQWGADESLRRGSPAYAPVKVAFVHHTASGNSYSRSQAAAVVRGIYHYHTRGLGWSDVGYNFLVDRFGTIYEGRFGGMEKGVIGAQTLGFNTGSTGISVIGDFTSATPPSACLTSLKRLLAWKLDVHYVDPQGKGTLTCALGQRFRTGQRVTFPAVSGHRHANYTACPGARLYAQLPALRRAAASIGNPKIYDLRVGGAAFSPNGDGVRDRVRLRFRLSESAAWQIAIGSGGEALRSYAGEGAEVDVWWPGTDEAGVPLPDGSYSIVVTATNAKGNARAASATVRVDTVAPEPGEVTVRPDPFSPNGDGIADRATVRFTPNEAGTARVSVVGDDGTVLRHLTGWYPVGVKPQAVAWDGRVEGDGRLVAAPDGRALLDVAVRDAAGNQTVVRSSVVVDRTLGHPTVQPPAFSPNGDGVRDAAVVGFRLSLRAAVTVDLLRAGEVLWTAPMGSLPVGLHALTWDGRLAGGEFAESGGYRVRITADSEIGAVAAGRPVTVDLYRPRITAPATAGVTLGRTARVPYSVEDPYSPTVRVTVVVRNARGATVQTVRCGWVRPSTRLKASWKPRARGTYTLSFRAVDRAGNRQAGAVVTTLRVR